MLKKHIQDRNSDFNDFCNTSHTKTTKSRSGEHQTSLNITPKTIQTPLKDRLKKKLVFYVIFYDCLSLLGGSGDPFFAHFRSKRGGDAKVNRFWALLGDFRGYF